MKRPTVYLYNGEKGVEISNLPYDDPKYDSNMIEVIDVHPSATQATTSNIIYNILIAAGCEVVIQ